MLDIHCHILPGVDDGAVDIADTLAMARAAVATGCSAVVASSHLWEGLFGTSPELIEAELPNARSAVRREGVDLEIFSGAENFYGTMEPEAFADKAVPVGEAGGYVLLDFAMDAWPRDLGTALGALGARDRRAVIAHPERNRELQADPGPLADWISAGAVVQVNAGSLLGNHGPPAKAAAERLLESGAAHVLASDAHGVGKRRPFCLDRGREVLVKMVGSEEAERMTHERPWRIVRGEPIETGPVRFAPPSSRNLWDRLWNR